MRREIKSRLKMVSLSLLFKLFLNQIIIASVKLLLLLSLLCFTTNEALSVCFYVLSFFIRWGKSKRRRKKEGVCVVCCGDLLSLSCEFNFFFPREREGEREMERKKSEKIK
jgi:hypothetical protein